MKKKRMFEEKNDILENEKNKESIIEKNNENNGNIIVDDIKENARNIIIMNLRIKK